MADRGTARSVSGEMMTAGDMPARGDAADIIDADYVEVTPEPRRVSVAETSAAKTPGRAGMATLDRRRASAVRQRGRPGGPLFWLCGCTAILAAFWISGGHALLRPDVLAGRAAAPDLQIANVSTRTEIVEGLPALLVDGDIRNAGDAAGRVPALAVQILSRAGESVVYRLGTLRTPLAPGAKYSFSGRLDMPKDGVETVSIAFDQ